MEQHYIRVYHDMDKGDKGKLLTFGQILNLSKASPRTLKKTIKILAKERFKFIPRKLENEFNYSAIDQDNEYKVPNNDANVEAMSFEELAICTGVHPLHLERSLYKIALLSYKYCDFMD